MLIKILIKMNKQPHFNIKAFLYYIPSKEYSDCYYNFLIDLERELTMQRLPLRLLLSAALAPLAFSPLSVADTPSATSISALATITVTPQAVQQVVHLDARLEAINQSTISAQTSGIVEALNFDINDQVSAGQTLIIINDSQQKAGLSQAEANLAQAEAMNEDAQVLLTRNRSLYKKNTLSKGELDSSIARAKSAAAAVLAAKASVVQAKEQLSYTKVIAPYSGVVSQRMIELGELVSPGQPLMTGFSAQPLRATTSIPQHLASQLSVDGDTTRISIKSQGQLFPIDSYTVFPYADSRYSSVQARIDLAPFEVNKDSSGLIPGAWVEVALPVSPADNKKVVTVPKTAVIQQGEVASIYIIDPNTQALKLRYVRLGGSVKLEKSAIDQVEVLSGINAGDRVVVNATEAAMLIRSDSVSGE
jgi:RND family efflux transporter MFP subunit